MPHQGNATIDPDGCQAGENFAERCPQVMPSILERLEYWVNKNPQKLLYAFLDLGGRETESYTYERFLQRIDTIAGHLRTVHRFEDQACLLLAYRPGLEMICAFFGCARAGLIPVPVYLPSVHGFQAALNKMAHVARDCGAAAILTNREYDAALEINRARNGNSGCSPEEAHVSKLKRIITEDMRSAVAEERFGLGPFVTAHEVAYQKLLDMECRSGGS